MDYSETSQVLVLFTRRHGKVRAIAKGVKRGAKQRFAVGVDLLEIGDVVLNVRLDRQANLAIVSEWTQRRPLSGLRERLPRMRGAEYAVEITAHLTGDWDPHPPVFEGLLGALRGLADTEDALPEVVHYQVLLLTHIGLFPRFDACVGCGRCDCLSHFSAGDGGMVCRRCEPTKIEKRELSAGVLSFFRGRGEAGAAPPDVGSFDVLDYYISHLIGRRPRLSSQLVAAVRRFASRSPRSGAERTG